MIFTKLILCLDFSGHYRSKKYTKSLQEIMRFISLDSKNRD